MSINISDIVDSKLLLIVFSIFIFINYIQDDNYHKIIIKY